MVTPTLGPFDSAWLKWGRAVLHGEALQAKILAVANDRDADFVTTDAQYDAKRHGFLFVATEVKPVPSSWALILGDAANNYRSCLDHLAWALVERGRTPPPVLTKKQKGRVYFPISNSATDFTSAVKNNLPGVRRADIAIIRRYQPYKVGPTVRHLHAIAVLQGVNNDDKHRTVRPLWTFPFSATIKVTEERGCRVTRIPAKWRARLVDVGTELGYIYVRREGSGAKPHIEVQHHFALQPSLTEKLAVHQWLTKIRGNTGLLLREFSDPPIDLMASAIES